MTNTEIRFDATIRTVKDFGFFSNNTLTEIHRPGQPHRRQAPQQKPQPQPRLSPQRAAQKPQPGGTGRRSAKPQPQTAADSPPASIDTSVAIWDENGGENG